MKQFATHWLVIATFGYFRHENALNFGT